MNYLQKVGVLLVLAQLALSINAIAFSSNSDSLALIDDKASSLYGKWIEISDTNKFMEAENLFTAVFSAISKGDKYEYALKIARLYKSNRENSKWLKLWYVRALDAFNSRSSILNKGLTSYQILEEKYAVLFEFTKVYSRLYGKCEDAVEVLRVYKTEYSFKYIHYNRGLD